MHNAVSLLHCGPLVAGLLTGDNFFQPPHMANNPRMVHDSNSSLLQLLRITITVAKSETKDILLRNTNDGYETMKIQETERN